MVQYVAAYVGTAVVFLAIDFVWLAWIARGFYASRMGDLLLETPNYGAAAVFYALYLVGVIIFAVAPALKTGSPASALLYGALFGFFAYATYDMTNYATLRNWPLAVSVVDMAWGTAITGLSAFAGYHAARVLS